MKPEEEEKSNHGNWLLVTSVALVLYFLSIGRWFLLGGGSAKFMLSPATSMRRSGGSIAIRHSKDR